MYFDNHNQAMQWSMKMNEWEHNKLIIVEIASNVYDLKLGHCELYG